MPICLRLLLHFIRAAASRTFWTAGSRRPMRMAMIAITTSNSMRVKPRDPPLAGDLGAVMGEHLHEKEIHQAGELRRANSGGQVTYRRNSVRPKFRWWTRLGGISAGRMRSPPILT